jgi:uncharacterized membrane protein YsdA (DUF1294 family)
MSRCGMDEWMKIPFFWVMTWYGLTSLVLFVLYGIDKRAARLSRHRIPEARLHFLALIGGIPGALFAQRIFRHKTRKTSFQLVTWAIVILHITLLVIAFRAWGWD